MMKFVTKQHIYLCSILIEEQQELGYEIGLDFFYKFLGKLVSGKCAYLIKKKVCNPDSANGFS